MDGNINRKWKILTAFHTVLPSVGNVNVGVFATNTTSVAPEVSRGLGEAQAPQVNTGQNRFAYFFFLPSIIGIVM